MSASYKHDILAGLKDHSFKYSEEPIYKLASGKMSNYYIDCRTTTLHPGYMNEIGFIFYEIIKAINLEPPKNIRGVGGLTMGADPIAIMTSVVANTYSYLLGRSYRRRVTDQSHSFCIDGYINPFIVRKAAKDHGIKNRIVGNVDKGDNVVIVDDVVSTGGSTIEAINAAREYGLNVIQAIALVDREEGGREEIEKLGVPFGGIFIMSDFIK